MLDGPWDEKNERGEGAGAGWTTGTEYAREGGERNSGSVFAFSEPASVSASASPSNSSGTGTSDSPQSCSHFSISPGLTEASRINELRGKRDSQYAPGAGDVPIGGADERQGKGESFRDAVWRALESPLGPAAVAEYKRWWDEGLLRGWVFGM